MNEYVRDLKGWEGIFKVAIVRYISFLQSAHVAENRLKKVNRSASCDEGNVQYADKRQYHSSQAMRDLLNLNLKLNMSCKVSKGALLRYPKFCDGLGCYTT